MKFETRVMQVESVSDHPNADRLSIVKLHGFDYKIVSGKLEDGSHRYKPNDIVVYVQQDSIVPEYLLRQGFWDEEKGQGILGGKNGDRVKPIKLRGVLSEGILFPTHNQDLWEKDAIFTLANGEEKCIQVGEDISEILGIKKFEPEIPTAMAGDVFYVGSGIIPKYDIENLKKYPNAFDNVGERLYVTEKLHGTFVGFSYQPKLDNPEAFYHEFLVFSKGLGGRGLVFKDVPNNENNLYVKTFHETKIVDFLFKISEINGFVPVTIFGEIFGPGVQDLKYNLSTPKFRAFDLYINGNFIDACVKYGLFDKYSIEYVPILKILDKFDRDAINELTNGESTFGGNIREGVVITPESEVRNDELGRLILKNISDKYLERKNGTEYQ